MANREDTKVTMAETISYEMVPETCPDLEAALDKLRKGPDKDFVADRLKSYGIEYSDNLYYCIHEIYSKTQNKAAASLRDTVLIKGTYPLRLALVKMIERTLPPGQPESRYVRWLRMAGVNISVEGEDDDVTKIKIQQGI